jgi:hypothetical protein
MQEPSQMPGGQQSDARPRAGQARSKPTRRQRTNLHSSSILLPASELYSSEGRGSDHVHFLAGHLSKIIPAVLFLELKSVYDRKVQPV